MSTAKVIGVRVTEEHLKKLDELAKYLQNAQFYQRQIVGRKYSKWTITRQDAFLWALNNVNIPDEES